MKKISILPLLLCLFLVGSAFAQEHQHADANPNITPYNDAAAALAGYSSLQYNQQAPWKNFITQHPSWGARFDRYTHLPHRAIGAPIVYANGSNDLTAKALSFIQTELSTYEIPVNELVVTRQYNDGKYINVDMKQVHQGSEVLWSRVSMRFTQQNEIVMFGLDAHNNIPANLPVSLSVNQAKQYAESALITPIISSVVSPDILIMPLPMEDKYEFRKVYKVITETQDTDIMPGKYESYVDAVNGKVLYRTNKVLQIGFNAKANIYPTNLFSTAQSLPLQHLKVVNGTQTLYTDVNGAVNFTPSTLSPTLSLEGLYFKVVTGANGNTVPTFSTTVNTNNSNVTFPVATSNQPLIQHFTAYYHGNLIHDFMKSKIPTFTNMDNPLLTRVDRTDGNCNAFYNGSSINFYTTASGCNALSMVNSVVYHEYGHGITNEFWAWQNQNFENGGMGEGYSDVWAFSITDDSYIGRGFYINQPNSSIRRYDVNPKVYPQDVQGQVHADGEIIAGAWWDTYQYWGNLGEVSDLFAESHFGLANGPNGAEGQVYFDILIDALQYDDTDNDITNGTPHFNSIVKGFADHGIYLLSNTTLVHNGLGPIPASTPTSISANIVSDFPAFVGDVNMIYRKTGTTPTTSLLMTKNGQNYTAAFPAQTAGDIFEYYFDVSDNLNSYSISSPKQSNFTVTSLQRNLPHYLLVGYKNVWQELFDGPIAPAGWTIANVAGDNASRGKWVFGTPVASFTNYPDSSTVNQPYNDVSGANSCLVTGNASSITSSIGTEDVDGGRTTVLSAPIDITGLTKPVLSYYRWFSNSNGSNPRKDFWNVQLSFNNGSTWFNVDKTYEPDVSWRRQVISLPTTNGNTIWLKFIANDSVVGQGGGSIVEAAVDAVELYDLGETPVSVVDFAGPEPQVYPNPAKNDLHIIFPTSGEASYQLLSAVGQVISAEKVMVYPTKAVKVNTSNVSPGIYYLRIEQNGKTKTEKITFTK